MRLTKAGIRIWLSSRRISNANSKALRRASRSGLKRYCTSKRSRNGGDDASAHHRPEHSKNARSCNRRSTLKRRLNASTTKSGQSRRRPDFANRCAGISQGLRVNRLRYGFINADQATATICYEYTTSSPPLSGLRGANGRTFPQSLISFCKVSVSNFVKSVPTYLVSGVQHCSVPF